MRWLDEAWNQLLRRIAKGETDGLTDQPGLQRLGATVTSNLYDALNVFCYEVVPAARFPLDGQWIAATNKLANEINGRVQEWRRQGGATVLGAARARCEIRTPFPHSPGLVQSYQINCIETTDTPDLPPTEFDVLLGDPCILLRNIDTGHGLARGRRCIAIAMRGMTVVVQLDNGQEVTFPRIPMEKESNGLKFVRWQIPLRSVFAGTVHRCQGMTLGRAVVDLPTQFWEQGQLYVALSRVRPPVDLRVLLPEDMTDFTIKPRMDPQGVNRIPSLNGAEGDGEMDAINGEHGDPDLADAPAALDLPDVPGDDEEAEPEQELPELDELDAFHPFPIAPAPTADFAQDHDFSWTRPLGDMVVIWGRLCQVEHELLRLYADDILGPEDSCPGSRGPRGSWGKGSDLAKAINETTRQFPIS
jgi:hypothetical protein